MLSLSRLLLVMCAVLTCGVASVQAYEEGPQEFHGQYGYLVPVEVNGSHDPNNEGHWVLTEPSGQEWMVDELVGLIRWQDTAFTAPYTQTYQTLSSGVDEWLADLNSNLTTLLGIDPAAIASDIASGFGEWIGPMILLGFAVVVVLYGLKMYATSSN